MLGTPELNTILQMGCHKSKVEGENPLHQPADQTPYDATQDSTGESFWVASTHYWPMLSFSSTITPKSFSSGLLSITFLPSLEVFLGLLGPRCRTLHFALLISMSFASAHLSCVSRSLWHPFPPACPHCHSVTPLSLVQQ